MEQPQMGMRGGKNDGGVRTTKSSTLYQQIANNDNRPSAVVSVPACAVLSASTAAVN